MGKGDRKTAKGKRFSSSYGNVRPHRVAGDGDGADAAAAAAAAAAPPVAPAKAPAARKTAAKKKA